MFLDNKLYDVLKWGCLVLMPALAFLMHGLSQLYGWGGVEQHVSLLNLIAMFLGTLLQLSSYQYHNDGPGGPSMPI